MSFGAVVPESASAGTRISCRMPFPQEPDLLATRRLVPGSRASPAPTYNRAMPSEALTIGPDLAIPEAEIVERFVRASGAGGQNVNKVSTAVELRFDIAGSPSLPEPLRARLLARRDRRLTDDGVLVIDAQRFRTQDRNRQDARERLAAFIAAGLEVPKPRIKTRPTRASKQRRLQGKRERAEVKRGRGSREWD